MIGRIQEIQVVGGIQEIGGIQGIWERRRLRGFSWIMGSVSVLLNIDPVGREVREGERQLDGWWTDGGRMGTWAGGRKVARTR